MSNEPRKYGPTIAFLYKTKSGARISHWTMKLNDETAKTYRQQLLDAAEACVPGAKLVVTNNTKKTKETSPDAFFSVMTAEEVAQMEANKKSTAANSSADVGF